MLGDAIAALPPGHRRGLMVTADGAGAKQEVHGLVPAGPADPVWWTLRRPFRVLSYPAARAMFGRANQVLGANWTLHDLRHFASYRLARDPQVPLTDVQWILGHAHLSTTELAETGLTACEAPVPP